MTDSVITLKERINQDVKNAMRAQDKRRLTALRLITAAIKQREVDERITVDDQILLGILEKMLKQRRDSMSQYQNAGRTDLADQESYEIDLIQGYLPQPLTPEALTALIDQAIHNIGAASVKDMGKVMALLRSEVQGKVDMAELGAQVKTRLAGK